MNAKRLLVLGSALLLIAAQPVRAITLNFANLVGANVSFSGGAFSFAGTNGYQFSITGVSGGAGDSSGFEGFVTPGGPFTIGAITVNGSLQSAPVTGSGTLHITDLAATDLTGSIQWVDIETYGVGGVINLNGVLNLTGITYGGSSSDLSTLASFGAASDVVNFQFVPSKTLTDLVNIGGTASYNGSIYAVPEPGTVTLVGTAIVGLLAFRRRRK